MKHARKQIAFFLTLALVIVATLAPLPVYAEDLRAAESDTAQMYIHHETVHFSLSKAASSKALSASYDTQTVSTDFAPLNCEMYRIDGSSYFKLRDLAAVLSGSGSQISVGWDEATGIVSIDTGASYTPVGGELVVGADNSASAKQSLQTIMINGVVRDDLLAYNIGGYNYFRLEDLSAALNFSVEIDAESNEVIVRSASAIAPAPELEDGTYDFRFISRSSNAFHGYRDYITVERLVLNSKDEENIFWYENTSEQYVLMLAMDTVVMDSSVFTDTGLTTEYCAGLDGLLDKYQADELVLRIDVFDGLAITIEKLYHP